MDAASDGLSAHRQPVRVPPSTGVALLGLQLVKLNEVPTEFGEFRGVLFHVFHTWSRRAVGLFFAVGDAMSRHAVRSR